MSYDVFNQQQAPAAPAPAPNATVAPLSTALPATDPTLAPIPGSEPIVETPPKDDSPMSEYKNLWQDDPKLEPGHKDYVAPTDDKPVALTEDALAKSLGQLDFKKHFTDEVVNAIQAGGPEAVQATAEVMTKSLQDAIGKTIVISTRLGDQRVEKALEAQAAKLPEMLRSQAVANHVSASNPAYSDPAIKPIIDDTRNQFALKFPDATPAEIQVKIDAFVVSLAKTFAEVDPNVEAAAKLKTAGAEDWETYMQL